jgi:hypothetical protein
MGQVVHPVVLDCPDHIILAGDGRQQTFFHLTPERSAATLKRWRGRFSEEEDRGQGGFQQTWCSGF